MPDFDFDIKKKEWRPKCVHDIVKEVGRSFEADLSADELLITGTDYVQHKRIRTDADLQSWLKTESKTYEKFIKVKVPDRLLPKRWQPKKMMVLAKSKDNIIAKYFGDEEVSTRQVQFTLKVLDCGHFRLKQTLQGSGPSPYWVIFEGKWARTPRGLRLEFCIRYPFQKHKKEEFDLAFEAMPDTRETSLAFTDETERQLAGNVPAIVGTDLLCWIELVQEHETESNPRARFNPEEGEEDAASAAAAAAIAEPPPPAGGAVAGTSVGHQPLADEEPLWPMYVGLAMFLALVLVFSWMHWGGSSRPDEL
mmetsp:Transcript_4937/g.14681  ORF Transcript_4937/g.14681 Transcript_4937/m.14681 type:complete len:308 (-) Transcript_4937:86-1009(-)